MVQAVSIGLFLLAVISYVHAGCYTYKASTAIQGQQPFSTVPADSEGCIAKCNAQQPNCKAIVYSNDICSLYSSTAGTVTQQGSDYFEFTTTGCPNEGSSSGGYGPVKPTNATCQHLKKPKKQFLGFVYKTDTAPDIDSCIDKCVKDQPKCKSGHYFSDSKECYLKAESEKGRPDLLVDVAAGSRDDPITYFEPCINGVPPRRRRQSS